MKRNSLSPQQIVAKGLLSAGTPSSDPEHLGFRREETVSLRHVGLLYMKLSGYVQILPDGQALKANFFLKHMGYLVSGCCSAYRSAICSVGGMVSIENTYCWKQSNGSLLALVSCDDSARRTSNIAIAMSHFQKRECRASAVNDF
jgi:hypothetical protein